MSLGAAVLGQAALFVSGVTAARLLGPEERGSLAEIALVVVMVTSIGACGLPLALTFEISRFPATRASANRLARRAILVQTVVGFPVALAAMTLLTGPGSLRTDAIGSLAIPGLLAQAYGLAVLQGTRDYMALNILRLVAPVLYATFALALLILGGARLPAVAGIWALANAVAGVAAYAVLRRPVAGGSALDAKRTLRFGLRAFLGSLSPLESFRFDQLVVAVLYPPASLGLYVVALAFSNWPRFVGQSIGLVAYPQVASIGDPTKARREMWRYFLQGSVASAACVIGLLLIVAPATLLLFGPEFSPSVIFAQLLIIAGGIAGARKLLTEAARGAGYVSSGSAAELVSWFAFVIASLVLAPRYQEAGVAAAMIVAATAALMALVAIVASTTPAREPAKNSTGSRLDEMLE